MREIYECLDNALRVLGRTRIPHTGTTIARGQERAVDLIDASSGLLSVRVWIDGAFTVYHDFATSATQFFADYCLPDGCNLVRRSDRWTMIVDAGDHDEMRAIEIRRRVAVG